jgi:hypothetical protein
MGILSINVTQEDIERGQRHECDLCPIALALLRAIPGANVEVVPSKVWILPAGKREPFGWELARLPDEAQSFMTKFDLGWAVEPFTFDLEVPDLDFAPLTSADIKRTWREIPDHPAPPVLI